MNQREAKRDSCAVAARLIENYMDIGQPWADHGCEVDSLVARTPCVECERKVKALKELVLEMDRRSAR